MRVTIIGAVLALIGLSMAFSCVRQSIAPGLFVEVTRAELNEALAATLASSPSYRLLRCTTTSARRCPAKNVTEAKAVSEFSAAQRSALSARLGDNRKRDGAPSFSTWRTVHKSSGTLLDRDCNDVTRHLRAEWDMVHIPKHQLQRVGPGGQL